MKIRTWSEIAKEIDEDQTGMKSWEIEKAAYLKATGKELETTMPTNCVKHSFDFDECLVSGKIDLVNELAEYCRDVKGKS